MKQPDFFQEKGKEHLMCKLNKFMYGLKQASKQWYPNFDEIVSSLGFKENVIDQCIYYIMNMGNFVILMVYVDDILLTNNDVNLLNEIKKALS